jgi:hypothetical protein
MPGKARDYSDFYREREDREEMGDTIVPKTKKPMKQEVAIMYSKAKKGKISKDALKRRLSKIYS